MARLNQIIKEQFNKLYEEEAPEETSTEETVPPVSDEATEETPPVEAEPNEPPVEGTEENNSETETENTEETNNNTITTPTTLSDEENNEFEDQDKNMEKMIGVVDIQHTTSSTTIDFEDGGQLMYVQPIISLKSETLKEIMDLINKDVEKIYASLKDEITGKELRNTKYWQSIETLIGTMVRSQLTKSDNMDGLVDEIKQVFKILEVK